MLENKTLQEIFTTTQAIAVVGHSDNLSRTSYQIAQFLRSVGYNIYPVNPVVSQIDAQPCYPSLAAIPASIDLVNVFRRSEFLAAIVEEAIGVGAKTVWAQLGVSDTVAAQKANAAGVTMIMNTCIKIEYLRWSRETLNNFS